VCNCGIRIFSSTAGTAGVRVVRWKNEGPSTARRARYVILGERFGLGFGLAILFASPREEDVSWTAIRGRGSGESAIETDRTDDGSPTSGVTISSNREWAG
jgi:hypothetical protein